MVKKQDFKSVAFLGFHLFCKNKFLLPKFPSCFLFFYPHGCAPFNFIWHCRVVAILFCFACSTLEAGRHRPFKWVALCVCVDIYILGECSLGILVWTLDQLCGPVWVAPPPGALVSLSASNAFDALVWKRGYKHKAAALRIFVSFRWPQLQAHSWTWKIHKPCNNI